jgi:hypothetical protein
MIPACVWSKHLLGCYLRGTSSCITNLHIPRGTLAACTNIAWIQRSQIMGCYYCWIVKLWFAWLILLAFTHYSYFWLVTSIISGWCCRHLMYTVKLTNYLFWYMGTGEVTPSSQIPLWLIFWLYLHISTLLMIPCWINVLFVILHDYFLFDPYFTWIYISPLYLNLRMKQTFEIY